MSQMQSPSPGKRPVLKLNYPPSHSGELGARQPNAGPSRPIGPVVPAKPPPQARVNASGNAGTPRKDQPSPGNKAKVKGPAFTPPKKAKPIPKQRTEEERQANIRATLKADRRAQKAAAHARRVAQQAVFAQMQTHAPTLFDPEAPKPLAIGIGPKLRAALSLSHRQAHGVLAWWTHRPAYQAALAAGGARYALDGTEDGAVTAAEQETAQARLGTADKAAP